jgi:metallo-beta-lactamase family protein
MLRDSAKVNGNLDEIKYIESINWSILDDDPGFKWGRVIKMAEGLRFSFLRSSHILGACGISVSWMIKDNGGNFDEANEKNIFFSGDIGPQSDANPYLPLLKPGHNPFPNTNYIVTEATYGSRTRDTEFQCSETRRKRLAEVILHTVFNKGGKVILPAFSLHRTQELLVDLHWWLFEGWLKSDQAGLMGNLIDGKYENPIRVLVDSPLGYRVTDIYRKNLFARSPNGKYKYLNSDLSKNPDNTAEKIAVFIEELLEKGSFYDSGNLIKAINASPKSQQKHNSKAPKKMDKQSERKFEFYPVIIASAGMCDAGPVKKYLEQFGNDPANTIILTGYQSSGTTGRSLMDRATMHCADPATLPINKAEVIDMSGFYSAHADQNNLLNFLFSLGGYEQKTPAKVLINHGNEASKACLEGAIRNRAALRVPGEREVIDVGIADARWLDLDRDEFLPEIATGETFSSEDINTAMAGINSELRDLKKMMELVTGRLDLIASRSLELNYQP